jgi:hypothetical protein
MSPESQVAQLQDLLERVQRNRLRLSELRTAAPEEAPPVVEAAALPVPEPPPLPAVLPAPTPPAIALPMPMAPAPVLPLPTEPAAQEELEPAAAVEMKPVEPEPELVPLPDEPIIEASEPFAEVTSPIPLVAAEVTSPIPLVAAEVTSPIPLVAEPPARQPDLAPRRFEGAVVASGPVAEFTGARVVQRSWSLDAVLFRAWRLGRDGGSR